MKDVKWINFIYLYWCS